LTGWLRGIGGFLTLRRSANGVGTSGIAAPDPANGQDGTTKDNGLDSHIDIS